MNKTKLQNKVDQYFETLTFDKLVKSGWQFDKESFKADHASWCKKGLTDNRSLDDFVRVSLKKGENWTTCYDTTDISAPEAISRHLTKTLKNDDNHSNLKSNVKQAVRDFLETDCKQSLQP